MKHDMIFGKRIVRIIIFISKPVNFTSGVPQGNAYRE